MLLYYEFNRTQVLLLITVQCTFNRPEWCMIILAITVEMICDF